mmetsp:Transcript_9068/g.22209  ORF Transcript_9068/g.22209 Transcript_9068/m.22209 type:complete len:237 (-) Transcript_9068:314-1024(-)
MIVGSIELVDGMLVEAPAPPAAPENDATGCIKRSVTVIDGFASGFVFVGCREGTGAETPPAADAEGVLAVAFNTAAAAEAAAVLFRDGDAAPAPFVTAGGATSLTTEFRVDAVWLGAGEGFWGTPDAPVGPLSPVATTSFCRDSRSRNFDFGTRSAPLVNVGSKERLCVADRPRRSLNHGSNFSFALTSSAFSPPPTSSQTRSKNFSPPNTSSGRTYNLISCWEKTCSVPASGSTT